MVPTLDERREVISRCTRFLCYHRPRKMSERLAEIAQSEYAQMSADVYGRGGFLAEFEGEIADLLGKESALFMPSGTMAQQIALRIWCDKAGMNRVAFHPMCHLEIHEQGGYRELHHLQAHLLGERDRLFALEDLDEMRSPAVALLIELPQREIGGQLPTWQELQTVCRWTRERGIRLHMDGARLWECAPFYGRSHSDICEPFDSVYVSFYKILGGLPGAALAGPAWLIEEARIWQRGHGGNLQTQTPSAISAKLGMARHLPRIPEYCRKASEIAVALSDIPGISVVPVQPPTNMMHLHIKGNKEAMEGAAWRIARDEGVHLFWALASGDSDSVHKLELTIGDAALELDAADIRNWFLRITENG